VKTQVILNVMFRNADIEFSYKELLYKLAIPVFY